MNGSNTKMNNAFIADMLGVTFLDNAVEWVGDNLEPQEVFDNEDLIVWVSDHGLTNDRCRKEILSEVNCNWDIDEVYSAEQIADWCADNGWVKEVE